MDATKVMAALALVLSVVSISNSFLSSRNATIESIRPRLQVSVRPTSGLVVSNGLNDAMIQHIVVAKNVGVSAAENVNSFEVLVVSNSPFYASTEVAESSFCEFGGSISQALYNGQEAQVKYMLSTQSAEYFVNPNESFYYRGVDYANSAAEGTYVVGCVTYRLASYGKIFQDNYIYKAFACPQDQPGCGPLGVHLPRADRPSQVDLDDALL